MDQESQESQQSQTTSWHESVADSVKADPAWDRFKDAESTADFANRVFTSYTNAEKKLGQKGLPVPAENAGPQAVRDWFTSLGCPQSPEAYERTTEGLPEGAQVDSDFEDFMAKECWGIGIAGPQWQRIRSALIRYGVEQEGKLQGQWNEFLQDAEKELQTELGAGYQKGKELADQALEMFWGEAAPVIAQIQQDGRPLGSHPLFLKGMVKLGMMLDEADLLKGQGPTVGTLTPEQAKAEWTRLQNDSGFMEALMERAHPGHTEAVARRSRLYKLMHPGSTDGKGAMVVG